MGNHESPAVYYESESVHYVGDKPFEIGGVKLVGLSGSTSSPTRDGGYLGQIVGYPYFVEEPDIWRDEQVSAIRALFEPLQ